MLLSSLYSIYNIWCNEEFWGLESLHIVMHLWIGLLKSVDMDYVPCFSTFAFGATELWTAWNLDREDWSLNKNSYFSSGWARSDSIYLKSLSLGQQASKMWLFVSNYPFLEQILSPLAPTKFSSRYGEGIVCVRSQPYRFLFLRTLFSQSGDRTLLWTPNTNSALKLS